MDRQSMITKSPCACASDPLAARRSTARRSTSSRCRARTCSSCTSRAARSTSPSSWRTTSFASITPSTTLATMPWYTSEYWPSSSIYLLNLLVESQANLSIYYIYRLKAKQIRIWVVQASVCLAYSVEGFR